MLSTCPFEAAYLSNGTFSVTKEILAGCLSWYYQWLT